jgi:predicted GNAT superfamily acetyltransferase
MPAGIAAGIEVRLVRGDEEYAACEAMSRDIWGAAERNVVPRELLKTVDLNGGIVAGAFTPQGSLVGFVFGFLGMREGRLRLCSHQLGVRPEWRGRGLGLALKQLQRRRSLELGYDLITWTFDPLEARNAYLNLQRLGTVARLYDRNHYGEMEDELNRGLPSDRFETEWWIREPHHPRQDAPGDAIVLLEVGPDGEPLPHEAELGGDEVVLIGVPQDFQAVRQRDMELARRWRLRSRSAIERALAAGLSATGFLRDGRYLMERLP